MSKYDWKAIKAKVDILEVVLKVVPLKRSGNIYKGNCPIHNENSPSFVVYDDGYHCFGCGAHGDAIDFIVAVDGCSKAEAIERLGANDFALTGPEKRIIEDRDRSRAEERKTATAMAARRWDAAQPATEDHPYLDRKMVLPHMARIDGKSLLLPVYDRDGEIMSVQSIDRDGGKLFQWGEYLKDGDGNFVLDHNGKKMRGSGAPTKGGRLNFGICIGRTIVCEGFATGASIYEAVPDRVAVGFSKSGVKDLVRELHGNGQEVVIASDRNALPEMLALGKELGIAVFAPAEPYDDFNDMAVAMYEHDATEDEVSEAIKAILNGPPLLSADIKAKTEAPTPANDETGPVDLWAKPLPPSFPRGAFPMPIEQLAIHRGEQAGCDPSGIAMAAFVACAGALSDTIRLKMRVHEPWFERPLLWGMLIGVPSTNKTAMLKCSTARIKEIDGAMFRQNVRNLADWQEQGGTKGSEPMPALSRLRVEDITMESAQEVCKNSPHGVISIQNELNGFFGAINKHGGDKGGGLDRSFWINAYDGGQYAVNRIGRGGIAGYIIDNLSVGILGGIQPDVIKRIMSGYSDDGIIQRFIPIVLADGTDGDDRPAPDVSSEFDELIQRLNEMRIDRKNQFFMKDYVEFSEDAQQVQYRTSKFHSRLVKSFENVNATLASHFGKFNGFFGRMCITMHCIENINLGNDMPQKISLETAERVETILHKFVLPHSIAFYTGTLGMSEDIERVRAVGGYILAHKLETVTMRTIGRNVSAMKRIDRFEAAKVFEQLEAFGWLEQANKRNDAPSWKVVEGVHHKFAERALSEVERRADVRDIIAETVERIRASNQ
ncbi:MAG: DUF3987 domain-containing protein [Hyphomicrobiaceae bacterium]|nr:MAG: DUF3987 domain-containing protein [Hyphomicrobiaceae bacterium]